MRTIKAIFEISTDAYTVDMHFTCNEENVEWEELTHFEKVKMLNTWANYYRMFENKLMQKKNTCKPIK